MKPQDLQLAEKRLVLGLVAFGAYVLGSIGWALGDVAWTCGLAMFVGYTAVAVSKRAALKAETEK